MYRIVLSAGPEAGNETKRRPNAADATDTSSSGDTVGNVIASAVKYMRVCRPSIYVGV